MSVAASTPNRKEKVPINQPGEVVSKAARAPTQDAMRLVQVGH